MSARGRGRAKVSKLKQTKIDRFSTYRNKILNPKKSSSGKYDQKSHHHHTIEDDDNANVFPADIERDDFENDNVSDSLLLASLPNSDSPTCKKRSKKVNFQITHKLDVRGFCEQCGIENPENQLCNGQWQIPKRTSTGWLQRNDDSPAPVNDIQSQSISSSSTGPLPSSSASSTSSIGRQTSQMMCYNEACAVQDELKLQDDTVSGGHCRATVNLDTVIIPPRNSTSADLEMWYLKSNDCYKIPAGKSLFVKSTVFADFTTEHPHTSRIDSITPFNHWLGQPIDANLAIRAGTLSPNFTGYIEVCIFNKGQKELIVKAGAPIAVLKRENYLL